MANQGVTVTRQRAWADSGVEEFVYEARWRAEPGWFAFDAESPTICMAGSEVGGRCEFRAEVDQPGEGGYFGPGALARLHLLGPIFAIFAGLFAGKPLYPMTRTVWNRL